MPACPVLDFHRIKKCKLLSCHSSSQLSGKNQFDHEETIVKCLLCAKECIIKENERGKCRARMNISGKLKSLVYGRPVSIHIDPIEKKPFYHFLPAVTHSLLLQRVARFHVSSARIGKSPKQSRKILRLILFHLKKLLQARIPQMFRL